jgi:TolA-binding protein
VASDDNESKKEAREPLPPSVERALAEARAAAASAGTTREGGAGSKGARWLALIPVTAAILTMLLMMPRAAPPEDVPLPQIDGKALETTRKDDLDRAAAARTTRLPGDVLLVGTALRGLNRAQMTNTQVLLPSEEVGAARTALENAVRIAASDGPGAIDALRSLRAVQLEGFLAEVERFESTGQSTTELEELGGGFLDRMAAAGWLRGSMVLLDDAARRAAYKLVWNAQIGVDRLPELALSLDEQRALYRFYITHPHAPEAQRAAYENVRKAATTTADCERAVAQEKIDIEQWRIDKIRRLGEIDPAYPTAFALGVAYYRAGRYDNSVDAFRSWIARHPDGPLTLRARNHMKAALVAFGPS